MPSLAALFMAFRTFCHFLPVNCRCASGSTASSAICTDFQPSRCVTARACAVTPYRHGCRPRCSQNLANPVIAESRAAGSPYGPPTVTAAAREDGACPVRRGRVAIGAGVQEERGERAKHHDPEQREDPHVEQPPDQV